MRFLIKEINDRIAYNSILKMSQNQRQFVVEKTQNTALIWENLKGWMTNIAFQVEGLNLMTFFSGCSEFQKDGPLPRYFYVAGNRIDSFQGFKEQQEALLWFTYRKNVRITPQIYSDVGWGCLLRVVQMAMANALLRFSEGNGLSSRKNIIKAFLQQKQAQFSILSFVKMGRELWQKEAGNWYSMTQATMVLEALHERNSSAAEDLSVKVANEVIYIDDLMSLLMRDDDSKRVINKAVVNQNNSNRNWIPQGQKADGDRQTTKGNKKIFLMITTQFSQESRYSQEKQLLQLMELPTFSSCLGGVPEKARFITGKYDDQIFYFDPHYVQESVQSSMLEQQMDTFTCKRIRSMSCADLQSSLTLCFYLQTQQDLMQLIASLDKFSQGGSGESLITYNWSQKQLLNNKFDQTQYICPDFQFFELLQRKSSEVEMLTLQELTA